MWQNLAFHSYIFLKKIISSSIRNQLYSKITGIGIYRSLNMVSVIHGFVFNMRKYYPKVFIENSKSLELNIQKILHKLMNLYLKGLFQGSRCLLVHSVSAIIWTLI